MDVTFLVLFVFIGMIAGLTAGLLGLSGGIVTVPALLVVFHLMGFSQTYLMHTAIGTSLAAMVINGLAAVISHQRRQGVMWEIVVAMIPGIFLGCMLGAFIAHFLSGILLQIIFGLFICFLGAYILLQKDKAKKTKHPDRALLTWIGIGVGTFASMLGIGGGVFTVPLLISYRYPEKKAVGTSATIGLFITFLAAMGYLYFGRDVISAPWHLGYIYLPAFLIIGFVTIFFAPLGTKIAHKIAGKKLRKIFAGTLILIGILMVLN